MSSTIRIPRICQHCGKEFIAKTTVTKYCGDDCAKKAYKVRMRKKKVEASQAETISMIQRPIKEIQAKEYLSIQETCQLIGVSRTTLWRLIKNQKLLAANTGNRVIIRRLDLERLFS